jgi:predicted secreted Zn-dependent protease
MPKTYFQRLVESFQDVVATIEDRRFDSHKFIGMLIKHNPKAYIDTLFHEYYDSKKPFQKLHADLAKELAKRSDLVVKTGTKGPSKNIHFLETDVEIWHKT